MAPKTISPQQALELADRGALLVDIRSADEFRRSKVPGAQNRPLDSLSSLDDDAPIVFMCRSGMRTASNAARLSDICAGDAYILEGGLDSWQRAGLPIEQDRTQPLEIMRQVQIAAGLLILIGVALGFAVSPLWFALAAFVGAGLTFAGATGWCGMARLLSLMPWNRRAAA